MSKVYSIVDHYGIYQVITTTAYKQEYINKFDNRNDAFDFAVQHMNNDDVFNHYGNFVSGKHLKEIGKESKERELQERRQYPSLSDILAVKLNLENTPPDSFKLNYDGKEMIVTNCKFDKPITINSGESLSIKINATIENDN